jgi:hemerythrin
MSQELLSEQDIPLVSIDFMNNTHQQEADIVNALARNITARKSGTADDAEITRLLDEWLQHTIAHFERENELMQQTGFPAYPVHAEEHEIALNRMQAVVDAWHQNQDIDLVTDYVFTLWPAWFKGHVNSMDMITAQFALQNGYSPD